MFLIADPVVVDDSRISAFLRASQRRTRKFDPARESIGRMEPGAELDRLRRLIAQADAMIAELQRRGETGDVELVDEIELVRDGLQRQLAALEPHE